VDGLGAGVYNYTITVIDSSGNSASDTVMVVVTALTPTTPLLGDNIMLVLGVSGAGIGIVIVVVLLLRRRQM